MTFFASCLVSLVWLEVRTIEFWKVENTAEPSLQVFK